MLELETFVAHPFLGTGPAAFDEAGFGVMSVHTEFSRLPAQHGIFGVAALLAMLLLAWRDVSSQRSTAARALTIALLAWAMLSMTHAAMRIAVVPFAFGMAATLFMARGEGPELARTPLARNLSA
jgi:O-antigen ligase